MFKLKLIKGRSYADAKGNKATAARPYLKVAEKEVADALVATGYFSFEGEIIDEANANDANTGEDDSNAIADETNTSDAKEAYIEKMTDKQLDTFAAAKGIDLTGLTRKADKVAAVQEALANSIDFSGNE